MESGLGSVPNHRTNPVLLLILPLAVLFLLATNGNLSAFEATGTVLEVDAGKNILQVHANGKDRSVAIAGDARILDIDGKALAGGLASSELKKGAPVYLSIENGAGGPVIRTLRLGPPETNHGTGDAVKPPIAFKPLTDMAADERYKGEDAGLYGGGSNEPPPAHLQAAKKQTEKIVPLDADGHPDVNGQIGLISISMSNATQEYSLFKQLADQDPAKSPRVVVVDCAQGGQAMAEWVDPAARAWTEAERRLQQARVSPKQVQVAWVKLANKAPQGDLATHGRKLEKDTLAVLQNAKTRFPNLRIAYLGSRIYGGYANSPLNPEPYAYEGAFAVRWLIQDQIKGGPDFQYDDEGGRARIPLLLWGPYLWANGTTPRKVDSLVWERKDLGGDGTHPSESGRRKVADMLLNFFKNDPLASTWFTHKSG